MRTNPPPDAELSTRDEEENGNPRQEIGEPCHVWRHWLVSLGLLAVLTLAMFGDVLFTSQNVALSNLNEDLSRQFVHWRAFGFGELRRGNLALWNPYVFSGAPFFGGFQAALLYPLNALFLILPLAKAINWGIALHVFLAGAFTYAWAARRGLRPPACFLSAVIFMFCGAHFPHIYAGHLPNLCALIWAPLLFLAIDGLFETPSLGWSLLGMFALAMQVLAGHPQYVFYTGVAAAIYCALCLFKTRKRKRFVLGLAGIVAGGMALSAVQLLTSFQESSEMLRSVGVPYGFAAVFSFPPENFLTLLAPSIFADIKMVPYWGRGYLWEMSLFIGVSGFVLAIAGVALGERRGRRFSVAMVVLLLLLALGGHTPLFKLLYHWVPGFNQFRGNSKFIFLASLFLALLAGIGFNELLKGRSTPRFLIAVTTAAGLLALAAAVVLHQSSLNAVASGWWRSVMLAMRNTNEFYSLAQEKYEDPAFVLQAARLASQSLFIGGATMALVTFLLANVRKHRLAAWLLLALAVAELFFFARKSLDRFDLAQAVHPEVKRHLETVPGDYRIWMFPYADMALSWGAQDIWGSDPGITLRYARLLALTQKEDPDQVTQELQISQPHPLFLMLRLRFMLVPQNNQLTFYDNTNGLPRVLLVQRSRVLSRREEIFSALTNAAFDPREEVILETAPPPQPAVSPEKGYARLMDAGTDFLTVEADSPAPAILLITDAYAKGWRARGLPGSCQRQYEVLPANYCLRAVPLAAGHHVLRLEYLPRGFVIGKWLSAISVLAYAGLLFRIGRAELRQTALAE